jgi:PRC-barrel domain
MSHVDRLRRLVCSTHLSALGKTTSGANIEGIVLGSRLIIGSKKAAETTKESTVKRQIAMTAAALLISLAPALAGTQAIPNEILPATPEMQAPAESPTTNPASSTSNGESAAPSDLNIHFLSRQMPDELLATDLLGLSAVNATNDTIGEVNDLVTDRNGKTVAAVIGVGGFLGIGEKDVAIPFEDLKFTRDENNDITIEVDISKEALKTAPDYQSLDEQVIVEGANKDKSRTY